MLYQNHQSQAQNSKNDQKKAADIFLIVKSPVLIFLHLRNVKARAFGWCGDADRPNRAPT